MELGVATFADLSGGTSPEQRMRDLLEEVELADQLGLDVFALGEHHRPDFLVGGTPQSVVRAAVLGLPLTIAIIGGQPDRFVPLVELYREAAERAGHDPYALPVAINTHAFLAETSAQADAAFAAPYLAMMNRIGRERGWPPSGREAYEALRSPHGALAVGSPEQVAEKLLYEHELFGHQPYLGQMSVGAVEHRDVLRSMELFGTEVAPIVREEVARREASAGVEPEVVELAE